MASQQEQYAAAVLRGIGAPVTPGNIAGFVGWSHAEGGDDWARHNPLNTTQNAPGARSINSVGVKGYLNDAQGIAATIQTLKNGHYGGILQAFHNNNPHGLAGAIGASPWGTSGSLAAQTIAAALGQHFNVPAGGGPAVSQAGGMQRPAGTPSQTIKVAGGGYVDKKALATAVLEKEVNRPISTGLHGNPLADYVSAMRSGKFDVAPSTTTVKLAAKPGMQPVGSMRAGTLHGQLGAGDLNPLGAGWTLGRTDQGVDANARPGTPIRAINDSKVVKIMPGWYNGQPLVLMQLTAGPNKGRYWYISEQIAGYHPVGSVIPRGAAVGHYAPSGTGLEIGWGDPAGNGTYAYTHGGYTEGQVTGPGADFRRKILKG